MIISTAITIIIIALTMTMTSTVITITIIDLATAITALTLPLLLFIRLLGRAIHIKPIVCGVSGRLGRVCYVGAYIITMSFWRCFGGDGEENGNYYSGFRV